MSLLPECRHLYPDNYLVFMQGGTLSHRAKATQNFLKDNKRTRMGTTFVGPESAGLFSLGYLGGMTLTVYKSAGSYRMPSNTNGMKSVIR